jgi:hypothetical protein
MESLLQLGMKRGIILFYSEENGTRMTRIKRMTADLIRMNPLNPRHPRAITRFLKLYRKPS